MGLPSKDTTTQSFRAVIAEDEATLRDELCEMISRLWPQLHICAVAADGAQALECLRMHKPQVLFLDIEMPGLSGLEVARHASGQSHVIFITAHDRYAVAAFERDAVDYVLKPVDEVRLRATVERVKARLRTTPMDITGLLNNLAERLGRQNAYLRWITASQGSEIRLITTDEVCYFRAEHKYTMVVTVERESVIGRPIKELAGLLDPAVFWQIHRGTIVNVRHVVKVMRDFHGQLTLRVRGRNETLPVSAPHVHQFKSM